MISARFVAGNMENLWLRKVGDKERLKILLGVGLLKRKGVTYGQLVEKLASMGIEEKEVNVRNKLSRGSFTAAYLLQCLTAIGTESLRL
jgi:hypothetical protein